MNIVKNIFKIIGIAIVVVVGIGLCTAIGWLLRWFIWLVCFVLDIFCNWAIIDWIGNHDTAMLVICSCLSPFVLLLVMISESSGGSYNGGNYSSGGGGFSYDNEVKEMNRNSFSFVDCSGAYRRWGDSFIDHKGNWCSWGSGFYDYDDNYIRWGNTYKDCSGAYRHWGDDFVDCAGDYVRIP